MPQVPCNIYMFKYEPWLDCEDRGLIYSSCKQLVESDTMLIIKKAMYRELYEPLLYAKAYDKRLIIAFRCDLTALYDMPWSQVSKHSRIISSG